jgi:DNA polymerase-3 subunit alpha
LFLVSKDGTLEEQICTVEDSSDLYAELKQLLGPRCISAVRKAAKPEMEQVS